MDKFVVSDFARSRMDRHGLTEDQVRYIIKHHNCTYNVQKSTVYVATLPDGRQAKARVRDRTLIDAFTTVKAAS